MANSKALRNVTIWLKVIRVRFLLASLIATINGLAIASWKGSVLDPFNALLTIGGVVCLHASVDLLNDYWDYKKGIDTITKRTKFSGGTGVLPEKLLSPRSVYSAGIIFLLFGIIIGVYFITIRGIVILLILIFATISIYFYSTNIANAGLGEVFVTVKGTLIVLGSFYVQTGYVDFTASYVGVIVGLLSANVLLINSFPDHNADKMMGKKTLTVILGKKRAAEVLVGIIFLIYSLITLGVMLKILPIYSLISFLALPLGYRAVKRIFKEHDNLNELILSMSDTILFSRICGTLIAISFIL